MEDILKNLVVFCIVSLIKKLKPIIVRNNGVTCTVVVSYFADVLSENSGKYEEYIFTFETF